MTGFCRIEGAQLDNNRVEQALKLVARNRKNAMFHKTQARENVLDYFNTVQRMHGEVKLNPQQFLPWNYQSNL